MPQSSVAELIVPSRKLKEKAGSGGLDPALLAKAQQKLEANTIDFKPIGSHLLRMIDEAVNDINSGKLRGKPAIQRLLYPVMELKAQGAMFHYPLITDISDTLINFLEAMPEVNSNVLTLVSGYKMAATAIFSKNLTGTGGVTGKELRTALSDAYRRFNNNIA
jgi:hypothetical protein